MTAIVTIPNIEDYTGKMNPEGASLANTSRVLNATTFK